jgi:FKBP-type peptidyl-prolyl cis-trans isomerase FkpA
MSQTALEKGKAFLLENGKRTEITTTTSGLQYEVLREGNGSSPAATDTVLVHYEGTLINGTVFDSSYKRNEPIDFPLNQVIKGWTEGVQLMKEGAKYRFYLPTELAYGSGGAGRDIGPNEALIFDVELLEVM